MLLQAQGEDLPEENLGCGIANGAFSKAMFYILVVNVEEDPTRTRRGWGEQPKRLEHRQGFQKANVFLPMTS